MYVYFKTLSIICKFNPNPEKEIRCVFDDHLKIILLISSENPMLRVPIKIPLASLFIKTYVVGAH